MTYSPPTSRREAVDEIMHSGFTTSAMLAVACAWPLPGELAEFRTSKVGRLLVHEYGDEACRYLQAWGRASCPWLCPDCCGYGWYTGMGERAVWRCCGRLTPYGDCCNDPVQDLEPEPVQVQCERCHGTGEVHVWP